jgi:hypothetical protein
MSFWIREIFGWLFMIAGLLGYIVCLGVFLLNDRVVEAGILAGVSTMLFRGGLHLVKVATAARVVVQARRLQSKAIERTRPSL